MLSTLTSSERSLSASSNRSLSVQRPAASGLGHSVKTVTATSLIPAADDQRLGNADRNTIKVGADFLHGRGGSHPPPLLPTRNRAVVHHAVVLGLACRLLDTVDALDDRFQRLW